jgi:hypothetical protein
MGECDLNGSWGEQLSYGPDLLAQGRDRWRTVVNAVMNLLVMAPRTWLFLYNVKK